VRKEEKSLRNRLPPVIVPPLEVISILVLVCLLLAFVVGLNKSGLTTGNLSNLVNYRLAVFLTLAGMLLGFIVEGSKMTQSILGKLVIISSNGGTEILIGALVSLALYLA
jgi:phosphate/sulfate permease